MCGTINDELILNLRVGLVRQLEQVTFHVATLNTEQSHFSHRIYSWMSE